MSNVSRTVGRAEACGVASSNNRLKIAVRTTASTVKRAVHASSKEKLFFGISEEPNTASSTAPLSFRKIEFNRLVSAAPRMLGSRLVHQSVTLGGEAYPCGSTVCGSTVWAAGCWLRRPERRLSNRPVDGDITRQSVVGISGRRVMSPRSHRLVGPSGCALRVWSSHLTRISS